MLTQQGSNSFCWVTGFWTRADTRLWLCDVACQEASHVRPVPLPQAALVADMICLIVSFVDFKGHLSLLEVLSLFLKGA